jgi:hypothetical protein
MKVLLVALVLVIGITLPSFGVSGRKVLSYRVKAYEQRLCCTGIIIARRRYCAITHMCMPQTWDPDLGCDSACTDISGYYRDCANCYLL